MKKFFKILITVILVVAIVLIGYGLYKMTNGFAEPVKSFYLKVDDEPVYSFGTGYTFFSDEKLDVEVKEVVSGGDNDYTVKVIPNKMPGKNFYLRGNYGYFAVSDLTDGFNVEKTETGFSLSVKEGTSLYVLCNILTNALDMPFDDTFGTKGYDDMFTLVVQAGNSIITIDFNVMDKVCGVELEDENIVF